MFCNYSVAKLIQNPTNTKHISSLFHFYHNPQPPFHLFFVYLHHTLNKRHTTMTYEEALEYAKSYITLKGIPIDSKEATKCIVEALEKQIPKTPTAYSKTWNGSIVYKCPACGGLLGTKLFNVEQEQIGCARCLSAIDWSEVE